MILDPLLIFYFKLGVAGAAWATVISQMAVALLLVFSILRQEPFTNLQVFRLREQLPLWGKMFKLGLPVALQNIGFASISMYMARLIASFGDPAIAAQKVGAQIESITWLTAEGFAQAVTTFVSQNHGNGKPDRALRGYHQGLLMISGVGIINGILLFFGSTLIFSIFLQEPLALAEGSRYLKIVSLSQAFMCYEMLASAAYNGFGRSLFPSFVVISGIFMRIPLSHFLISLGYGVASIWWAISISSIVVGTILIIAFEMSKKKMAYEIK